MADNKQIERMAAYHKYLNENYNGGSERFFSPTGFLDTFQKTVELQVDKTRKHVLVTSVDDAVTKLEPIIAGQQGVFDLTAEPGTGKTSVLPFRFTSKKVVVALPTPFDAWSAYQMATGNARLRIKGLSLGSERASVVYTDSYLAAKALMSNYLDYDILIVDECDSSKGVTRFLAEVKAPGKILIRMSASHGRSQSGSSKSFQVTETNDMPDPRTDMHGLATYVGSKAKGRSLLLMSDADSAAEIHRYLPDSKLITSRSELSDVAKIIMSQKENCLYVSDDVSSRGINLNLDGLFDTQLIAEHGNIRTISQKEYYQRVHRVGRNRPGWYYSPGLPKVDTRDDDVDIFRHNVVRAISNLPQEGGQRLQLTLPEANLLMCSDIEPFVKIVEMRAESRYDSSDEIVGSPESQANGSDTSSLVRRNSMQPAGRVKTPSWMFHFGATSQPNKGGPVESYVTTHKGRLRLMRRSSNSNSSSSGSEDGITRTTTNSIKSGRPTVSASNSYGRSRALLPMAENAPYAVSNFRPIVQHDSVSLPMSPPVMDLNEITYDMDWPSLIRDRLVSGGDLPTLVPPQSWRHTSTGGMGTDWLRRLDDLSTRDTDFNESEFEVVCRAWNKLVAMRWVKQTPGLSSYSDRDRIEYCARYFQSYFLLASAE